MSKSGREYFRLGAESYSSLGRVGKKRRKYSRPLLAKFSCGQLSSPRLYRLKTWINFFKIHPGKQHSTEIRDSITSMPLFRFAITKTGLFVTISFWITTESSSKLSRDFNVKYAILVQLTGKNWNFYS